MTKCYNITYLVLYQFKKFLQTISLLPTGVRLSREQNGEWRSKRDPALRRQNVSATKRERRKTEETSDTKIRLSRREKAVWPTRIDTPTVG